MKNKTSIWNVPNIITVARIFMVPVIIGFLIWDYYLMSSNSSDYIVAEYLSGVKLTIPYLVAGILFIVASISDAVDGYIARKSNQISTFGKVFDPSADKILVNSILILMAISGRLPIFIIVIMISRDIVVDASRIVLGNKGVVVPANKWGKQKTIWQMVGIIMLFFVFPTNAEFPMVGDQWWSLFPMYIATFFSVFSGVIYLKQAWPYIIEGEDKNEKSRK